MIKVYISGNHADVIEREPLTSGTVGKVINFAFTEDWRLLIKYAVFEGSGRRIALTNIGDSCIIPHEVLAKHGGALRVGVYGRTADGSAATPTVYAQLGIIQRGADPNADPSTKPTLPVWAQIQAQIGDLSNLTTEDKTSLVAAINEAAKSGGGSGGGKDGTGIESITYKGEDESGGNMYTVLLTDGTSYDITAPKGAAGADGITPHIGDNGNWYLGTTDTGKPSRGETGLQGPVGPVGPQGPQGEKGEDAAADRTLGLTGATVGQIAKIAAVDASGMPTAWSPVDMPSGGGGETWEELTFDIPANDPVSAATINFPSTNIIKACIKISLFGTLESAKFKVMVFTGGKIGDNFLVADIGDFYTADQQIRTAVIALDKKADFWQSIYNTDAVYGNRNITGALRLTSYNSNYLYISTPTTGETFHGTIKLYYVTGGSP